MKFPALLLFISIFFSSCDKYHARKFSGTYYCQVHYYYWIMNQGILADTNYMEDIEIKREGKKLIVLENEVHIDSLWKDKEYFQGDAHNYLKVQFKNDKVYVTSSSGGLGGNASWKYVGVKQK